MRAYVGGDPLDGYLDMPGACEAVDPLSDWIGDTVGGSLRYNRYNMGPGLNPGPGVKLIGDPGIKNYVSFNYGGDQVSGADLDELAELDAAIKLLVSECNSQAPRMFPDQVSGDAVGWSWPWEDETPVVVLKTGVSEAVPGVNPAYQTFKTFTAELGAFYSSDWSPWYSKNGGVLSSLGATAEAQLESYKQRFNQFRAKAISLGVETGTSEIRNQIKDGAKSSWDKFWEAVPWRYVVPIAGVVLLPFYLPVLSGFVYAVFKIKKGGVKSLAA